MLESCVWFIVLHICTPEVDQKPAWWHKGHESLTVSTVLTLLIYIQSLETFGGTLKMGLTTCAVKHITTSYCSCELNPDRQDVYSYLIRMRVCSVFTEAVCSTCNLNSVMKYSCEWAITAPLLLYWMDIVYALHTLLRLLWISISESWHQNRDPYLSI